MNIDAAWTHFVVVSDSLRARSRFHRHRLVAFVSLCAWISFCPPGLTTFPIDGILQSVEINAQTSHDDMEDALKDLEALMSKAKEMVCISVVLLQASASA